MRAGFHLMEGRSRLVLVGLAIVVVAFVYLLYHAGRTLRVNQATQEELLSSEDPLGGTRSLRAD